MPEPNSADPILLKIKVTPNASRNEIVDWQNDALKIHIQSPPQDGKANKALVAFLAKRTGLSKSRITIDRGETSRQKWIAFSGIDRTALLQSLGIEDPMHG